MKYLITMLAVLGIAGAAAAECVIPEPANFASRNSCPADLKNYLARAGGCQNIGDEKTQSRERGIEIGAVLCDLRCGQLVKDGQDLQAKYAQDAQAMAVMAEFTARREIKDYNTLNCQRVIQQR